MAGWWLVAMLVGAATPDAFIPADAGAVRITGWLGQRLDSCIDGGLVAQDIEAVVKPYRDKIEVGDGDWRCEYWGKWFTGLALGDAYRHDAGTARVRDAAVKALIDTAAPDGYLGTRQPADRGKGWDIWGRKYALLGLIAAYDRTHDKATLAAAQRAGDTILLEYGPGARFLPDWGYPQWKGLPSNSVLEPIVLLYERTGEARYLDFARHIVAGWSKPSRLAPGGMKLIEDALAGKPPSGLVAPKAYEMMSCFEGLCELYRVTREPDHLRAATRLAEGVLAREVTLVGCGTSGELWCDGHTRQTGAVDKPMETCVTATWMKLCYQLLRLTGEPRWADELERNLYNGLLAAEMPDGHWWAYFGAPNGERVPSYTQHADVGLSCCVVNGPRGLLLAPSFAYGRGTDGPVVNVCTPGSATLTTPGGQALRLAVDGDYPYADLATLTLDLPRAEQFTLSLRIPAWSTATRLSVNGQAQPAKPGAYARVKRTWRRGDKVSVAFDLRTKRLAAPDGNGQVALVRGPLVLSLDDRLTPPRPGASVTLAADAEGIVAVRPNPEAARRVGVRLALDVAAEGGTLTFCDYASAGGQWATSNRFRSWLPQPLDLTNLYETGQTWQSLSHQRDRRPTVPRSLRVPDPAGDLALLPGVVATADSEYDKEPGGAARAVDGQVTAPDVFDRLRWHSAVDKPHPHWLKIAL
ncbi:MAG: glycoside hydrolase family 127 protein, partial [Armatimonadetes bacterium]|nr:glycoside hydrolase family 127 protein [Armatimonadota bacterium]